MVCFKHFAALAYSCPAILLACVVATPAQAGPGRSSGVDRFGCDYAKEQSARDRGAFDQRRDQMARDKACYDARQAEALDCGAAAVLNCAAAWLPGPLGAVAKDAAYDKAKDCFKSYDAAARACGTGMHSGNAFDATPAPVFDTTSTPNTFR